MRPNDWAVVWVLTCTVHLTVLSCHVTYAFQSESTLYACLNVKELFAQSRCEVWILSDSNRTRTQNHLVRKRTLKHSGKLAKWLSCILSTYLYNALDCMFLSCHVRVSEWVPHSIVAWMWRKPLLEEGANSEVKVTATGLEPRTT